MFYISRLSSALLPDLATAVVQKNKVTNGGMLATSSSSFRTDASSSSSSSLYLVKKNRMKIGKCNNITWKRRKMERARKTIDYVARAGSWAAAGC